MNAVMRAHNAEQVRHARTGHEQHRAGGKREKTCGSEIGLFYHEHRHESRSERERKHAVHEGANFRSLRGECGGEIDHERELCKFRRFELHRADAEPARGAAGERTDVRHEHEHEREEIE